MIEVRRPYQVENYRLSYTFLEFRTEERRPYRTDVNFTACPLHINRTTYRTTRTPARTNPEARKCDGPTPRATARTSCARPRPQNAEA